MISKTKYNRPFVLTVAGFDPSGGAGILADIKTFEQCKVIGLAATTSTTIQTENKFEKVYWLRKKQIEEQIEILFSNYSIGVAKIGLVENEEMLLSIIALLKKRNPTIKIIWDTILKSSSGFDFKNNFAVEKILKEVFLITPNYDEAKILFNTDEPEKKIESLKSSCNILLKGGHNKNEKFATDILFADQIEHYFQSPRLKNIEKHGSGCVLSSAIAANLALGSPLIESCNEAKKYVTKFLMSNNNLLGFHH